MMEYSPFPLLDRALDRIAKFVINIAENDMAQPLGFPPNNSNKQRPSFKYANPADKRAPVVEPVPDADGMITKPNGVRVRKGPVSPEDHAAGKTPNSGKLKKDGSPVPGQSPEADARRAAERASTQPADPAPAPVPKTEDKLVP